MEIYEMKIPYDQINWEGVNNYMREQKEKEKLANWKPYQSLAEHKKKRGDHTGQFKEVYKGLEKELKSTDSKISDLGHLKFGAVLKEIAGRPLTAQEIKNIIIQCEIKNPRHKINAFGELYITKEISSKWEIENKNAH